MRGEVLDSVPTSTTADEVDRLALGVIESLLLDGLVEIGSVTDGGFVP